MNLHSTIGRPLTAEPIAENHGLSLADAGEEDAGVFIGRGPTSSNGRLKRSMTAVNRPGKSVAQIKSACIAFVSVIEAVRGNTQSVAPSAIARTACA